MSVVPEQKLDVQEEKKVEEKTKNACLLIVTVFLDLAILDLENVNFVNKIDFVKE